MLLGVHESVAGGLEKAFGHATNHATEALQIFTKNSSQWREPLLDPSLVAAFRLAHGGWGGRPVIAHGSYLVNLCSDRLDVLERSREAVIAEVERCGRLGIDCVAFHPGAAVGVAVEPALDVVAEGLSEILQRTAGTETRLCLENTAGQGSCLGCSLDELAAMIGRTRGGSERIGVCLDTQHLFAAGYDLTTPAGYDAFFAEFDAKIGIERLVAFHLNDSKKPLGQRVDRHEEIGLGEMGLYPFWRLVNDARFERIPGVVELPEAMAMSSLKRLFELRGAPEPVQKKIVLPLQLTPPPAKAAKRSKR
ncbi:MAG TPA: deoxyribonuclease IV [Polyangiaceae bacterium]